MNSPRQAIVTDITRPPVAGRRLPWSSPGPTIYRGGHPCQARPDTIRFLKERVEGNRAMVAVEFEDTGARPRRYIFGAVQQPDGIWKAAGRAGGGGGPEPQSRGPWANFGGWGWPRPAEVETAELLHHHSPHLHPEKGTLLAAEQAQVRGPAAARQGRAAGAVQGAGIHAASSSAKAAMARRR